MQIQKSSVCAIGKDQSDALKRLRVSRCNKRAGTVALCDFEVGQVRSHGKLARTACSHIKVGWSSDWHTRTEFPNSFLQGYDISRFSHHRLITHVHVEIDVQGDCTRTSHLGSLHASAPPANSRTGQQAPVSPLSAHTEVYMHATFG